MTEQNVRCLREQQLKVISFAEFFDHLLAVLSHKKDCIKRGPRLK